MSPETFAVLVLAAIGMLSTWMAYEYRRRALTWRSRSQHWFEVAMQVKPLLSEGGATRLLADLFPHAPSTTRDVERQREYREFRALTGDHKRLHWCDATNDSEAATEIMQFCIGGLEVEGE